MVFALCGVSFGGDDGLTGWWNFDAGNGKLLEDASPAGNAGQPSGSPRCVPGVSGSALGFAVPADEIRVEGRDALDLRDSITLACWVKVDPIPPEGEPVIAGKSIGTYALTYYRDNVGPDGTRLYAYIAGRNVAHAIPLDAWTHAALVFDGKTIQLFLDGELRAEREWTGPIPGGDAFSMGRGDFRGAIDDCRVYGRALTPGEVRALCGKPSAAVTAEDHSAGEAPSMNWVGTREGITTRVLAPWTPVEVRREDGGLEAGVWGRTYSFDGRPFPVQMESQGRLLLAEPMELQVRVDGREVQWGEKTLTVRESAPDGVRMRHEVRSNDGALAASAETLLEYDGMVRVHWRLAATTNLTLEAVSFRAVFPPERATYFNWAYTSVRRTPPDRPFGILPAAGFASDYIPFLWIGDDERGLNWMCESDRGWHLDNPGEAIRIFREGEHVVLHIRLIDQPRTLSPGPGLAAAEVHYTFGLMATPAKPLQRDGWDLRLVSSPAYGRDYAVLTDTYRDQPQLDLLAAWGVKTLLLFNWTDILCYPAPVGHEQDLRDLVAACHDHGMKVIPYFGSQMSERAPEWSYVGEQIRVLPENRSRDAYPGMDPQSVHMVCNRSAYQDFLVHGLARLLDEYDMDGVYLDGVGGAWYCNNTLHGCGYAREDGSVAQTFPYFATRNTLRRMYTVVKSRKPDGIVFVHQSSQMLNPVSAWCDMIWDGEQFGEGDAFPLDVVSLDAFRCEFTGRQLGVPVDFIYYTAFRPAEQTRENWIATYRQAHALTLLHDGLVAATGMNYPDYSMPMIELASSLWRLGETFDRKNAEWLPYWRNGEYVGSDHPDVIVSLYRHPRNGVLAFVSNLGKVERTSRITFRPAALGLDAGFSVRDAFTDDRFKVDDHGIDLSLSSLDWKSIWLKADESTMLGIQEMPQ